MAKVKFTGDPRFPGEKVEAIVVQGVEFPLNKDVEIADGPLVERLAKNSHFKVTASGKAGEK